MNRLYCLLALLLSATVACATAQEAPDTDPGATEDLDVSELSEEDLSTDDQLLHQAIESFYGPSVPTIIPGKPQPEPAPEPEAQPDPDLESQPAPEAPAQSPPEEVDVNDLSEDALSTDEQLLHQAIESIYGPSVPTIVPGKGGEAPDAEPAAAPLEEAPAAPEIPVQPLPANLAEEPDIYQPPKEMKLTQVTKGPYAERQLPEMVCRPPVVEGIGALPLEALRPKGHPCVYASLASAVAAHDLYSTLDLIYAGEAVRDPAPDPSPILIAAEQGDAHILNALWNSGLDRNATDALGNHALHLAAAANQVYTVRMLHRRGEDLGVRNARNYTPLHVAAEEGAVEAVDTLVALGANMLDNVDPGNFTPPLIIAARARQWEVTALLRELGPDYGIHRAAGFGDIDAVREMITRRPARINEENHLGQSPLFVAVGNGEYDMALFLLQNRADVHAIANNGESAFSIALQLPTFDIAELLLKAGARVDGIGAFQIRDPLLHRAARTGDLRILDFLLDRGADIEINDFQGETAVFAAAREGQYDAIRRLAERGANLAHRSKAGQSALHVAADLGRVGAAECLLDVGADVNARARLRYTPLHAAVHADHPGVVRLLLDRNARVAYQDLYGRSPLHLAAIGGQMDIARMLGDAGAPVDARDRARNTPLHLAAEAGQYRLADCLLARGAALEALNREGRPPLALALGQDHFGLARHLAGLGSRLDTIDLNGRGLAHIAAALQRSLPLEWLLFMGVDPNMPDEDGVTPLHIAAELGGREVLGLLLDHHADVNPADRYGRTPLHRAALRGDPDLVGDVLRAGADPALADGDGRMPLHLCALAGNVAAAMPFFERGQDPNRADAEGNTVVHAAVIGGSIEFLRTVLRKGGEFCVRNNAGQTPIDLTDAALLDPAVLAFLSNDQRRERHWRYSRMRFLLRAIVYEEYRDAAIDGRLDRITTLLDYYPEYMDHTSFGITPLHGAARYGRTEVVDFLLDHGADINRQTDTMDGFTPIQEAIQMGNIPMMHHLAERGADLARPSALGKTIEMVAIQKGNETVITAVRDLLEPVAEPVASR